MLLFKVLPEELSYVSRGINKGFGEVLEIIAERPLISVVETTVTVFP